MSGWKTGETRDLFDPITGRWMGLIDLNGNEQILNGDALSALVSAAGNSSIAALAAGLMPLTQVASVAAAPQCVFAQFPNGKYLCHDFDPGAGDGTATLGFYNGDPSDATSYSTANFTRLVCTKSLVTGSGSWGATGLKSADTVGAAEIGNGANSIPIAWLTSANEIWFIVITPTGNHLFRAHSSNNDTGGTWTVGADAAKTDRKASISIGNLGGTQTSGISALSQRSFLEATIAGAKVYFFCEYNTNGSRVNGSTNDQAIVYKSTDFGTTWTVFLQFNTDGSTHQIDHFHGAVQDPYTGHVYFMTGDDGAECALIRWDGVAAAPAANTSLATLGATAGWKVISGTEMHRYTDLCFGPTTIFSIPDADTEAGVSTSTAFVSAVLPKNLDYVSSVAPLTRVDSIPPLLKVQSAVVGALMISFRAQTGGTAGEPYFWVWGANSNNGDWVPIAKLKNWYAATGSPRSFFIDQSGRVWVGVSMKVGARFINADSGSAKSSSACITLAARSTLTPTVFVWDGVP